MNSRCRLIKSVFLLVVVSWSVTGCQMMGTPFNDELAGGWAVTTPSVEVARAVAVEATVNQRPFEAREVGAQNGAVTHSPLYFQDPFERPDGDDYFAWSGQDLAYGLYGPVRFLANTVFLPVSAALAPPWAVETCDGRPAQ